MRYTCPFGCGFGTDDHAIWMAHHCPRRCRVEEPIEKALASQAGEDHSTSHQVLAFLNDLCHPDQYGHAVTREVRKRARELATQLEEELRQP